MKQFKKLFLLQEDDKRLPTIWSIAGFGFFTLLFYLMFLNYTNLPRAYLISDEENHPDKFISERAKIDLEKLTIIGPKVSGSPANEVAAVQILLAIISEISQNAKPAHHIEVDHSITDGQFYGTRSSVYRGLQNIVVKLSPAIVVTNTSLLMNSHFDSVPTSPGGGDAIAQIAVMLEILRKISKMEDPLRHSIVFLFNGAEEIGLFGAHAFITQHKWAKDVKAFVNLDSAGNGGREMMFRAGPNNPWMINYYRKTASHPYTTVMAEEMFQANLVPADTDYRYFVEFGHIPGLDFAQISNGYVYHTKYDRQELIPIESLQNTGNNILALTLALANSDELPNAEEYGGGEAVFFDFLGWFLVYYNTSVEIAVNLIVMLLAVAGVLFSMFLMSKTYDSIGTILREFFFSFIIQAGSIVFGGALSFIFNLIFFELGTTMSWYAEPWMIFGMYCKTSVKQNYYHMIRGASVLFI